MTRFDFRFAFVHRVLAAPFGITPRRSWVEVDDSHFTARFGPWLVQTPLTNIAGCERVGPFGVVKTGGPPRVSWSDRGLSFASNSEAGLCLSFDVPVSGVDPLGRIRHPGLTVTVEQIEGLERALSP